MGDPAVCPDMCSTAFHRLWLESLLPTFSRKAANKSLAAGVAPLHPCSLCGTADNPPRGPHQNAILRVKDTSSVRRCNRKRSACPSCKRLSWPIVSKTRSREPAAWSLPLAAASSSEWAQAALSHALQLQPQKSSTSCCTFRLCARSLRTRDRTSQNATVSSIGLRSAEGSGPKSTVCNRDICGSRPRWKLKHRSRVDAVQRQACFPPLYLSTPFNSLRERLERGSSLIACSCQKSRIQGARALKLQVFEQRPWRCRWRVQLRKRRALPSLLSKSCCVWFYTLPKKAAQSEGCSPELSSGLMSSSCVMTEAVRLLLNRSHHLTCCMGKICTETPPRETLLASFDCRSRLDDRDSSDFESFRLHELGPLVLHDVLESARMIHGSQQQLFACCLQLGELFLRCRGPVLMPHGTHQAHWQTYFRTPGFPTGKDDVPSVRPWRVSVTGRMEEKIGGCLMHFTLLTGVTILG